jgi:Cytochrome c3
MMRFLKFVSIAAVSIALLAVVGSFGASQYYTSQLGSGCANCHEMADYVGAVHGSNHRNVGCQDCHTATMSTKLRHIRVHITHSWPEEIRLRDVDVVGMTKNCQQCHQQEYATWHAGPHSVTYSQIFMNNAQNSKQHLMEDCFRCHGMHFDGSVRDLVQPVDTKGPWHMVRSDFADQPTVPCQSCHWVHRPGTVQQKPSDHFSVAGSGVNGTLAFFDRRDRIHLTATSLQIPQLQDGARLVKMSSDPRQAMCYQCHGPRIPETGTVAANNHWGPQVGTGDDRTPTGVHEGLSCVACHNGHNENARASCATCHAAKGECKLDVEKMDTTYFNTKSAHNIHWVKCADCHQNGIPKSTPASLVAGQ